MYPQQRVRWSTRSKRIIPIRSSIEEKSLHNDVMPELLICVLFVEGKNGYSSMASVMSVEAKRTTVVLRRFLLFWFNEGRLLYLSLYCWAMACSGPRGKYGDWSVQKRFSNCDENLLVVGFDRFHGVFSKRTKNHVPFVTSLIKHKVGLITDEKFGAFGMNFEAMRQDLPMTFLNHISLTNGALQAGNSFPLPAPATIMTSWPCSKALFGGSIQLSLLFNLGSVKVPVSQFVISLLLCKTIIKVYLMKVKFVSDNFNVRSLSDWLFLRYWACVQKLTSASSGSYLMPQGFNHQLSPFRSLFCCSKQSILNSLLLRNLDRPCVCKWLAVDMTCRTWDSLTNCRIGSAVKCDHVPKCKLDGVPHQGNNRPRSCLTVVCAVHASASVSVYMMKL